MGVGMGIKKENIVLKEEEEQQKECYVITKLNSHFLLSHS